MDSYEFQYAQNVRGRIKEGVVILRVAKDSDSDADADAYIDVPVHKDFLMAVSGLVTKMVEDIGDAEIGPITLPRALTPEALDEFLCWVYGVTVKRFNPNRFEFFDSNDRIITLIGVLDFFQAPEWLYVRLDEYNYNLVYATFEDCSKDICKACQNLCKFETYRARLPKIHEAYKRGLVRTIVKYNFTTDIFLYHEQLVELDRDTMMDLWRATLVAQSMIWISEKEAESSVFKKRTLKADDAKFRAEYMGSFWRNMAWDSAFQKRTFENVVINHGSADTWPVLLVEFDECPRRKVWLNRCFDDGHGTQFYVSASFLQAQAAVSGEMYIEYSEDIGEDVVTRLQTLRGDEDGDEWYKYTKETFVPQTYTLRFNGSVRVLF